MKVLKKYKIILIILVLIASAIGLIYMKGEMNKINNNTNNETDLELVKEDKQEDENNSESEELEVVSVDIKGAVTTPGVYQIESNKKVIDVINLAGGLKDDANTSLINLAKKVSDEMVVVIYTDDEIQKASKDGNSVIKPIDSVCTCPKITNDACINGSDDNTSDSTTNSTDTNTSTSSSTKTNSKVNINTATLEELETLSGIGESKAQAIIDYRNTSGSFTKIEDILNVSGIGESLYEKIKNNITV